MSNADQQADAAPDTGCSRDWVAVSFTYADLAWCDWLYREFDGERVPRPLLGRPSRDGRPYPDRISVTPDPADSYQLEKLDEAILAAQHMILIVSPNSAHDPLHSEHMRMFKAAGGEQRMIALVVKGEPASPAAEPGCDADRAWLPKWLAWRFENNTFQPAGPDEPLVVDARLGASSLAEVRMKIFAAILEVPPAALQELGVVSRAALDVRDLPAPSKAVLAPIPDPLPEPRLADPLPESAPGASKWPLILCGMGAGAALCFLAFGPVGLPESPSPRAADNFISAAAAAPSAGAPQDAAGADEERAFIAIVPMEADPLPDFTPPPPPPVPVPKIAGAASRITPAADPVEQARREIAILSAKRDRLSKLAESQLGTGNGEEAMAVYQEALDVAQDIVHRDSEDSSAVIELARIHRRLGHLAMNLSSAAEARASYERGRTALFALRSRGTLSAEGGQLLRDIEKELRSIPRD